MFCARRRNFVTAGWMLCLFCLVTAFTGSADAETPDSLLQLLVRHAAGETISKNGLTKDLWRDDVAKWNSFGGSQNLPMIARAAVGDYQWMARLARLERREGLFGRELGSPGFYFHMPVASKMVALRDARKAGAAADASAIRLSLRAVWAYESLLAVETPRTRAWMNASGDVMKGKGDSHNYKGLTVAVAGERWHSDRYIDHDDHGIFLSWALDWTPRSAKSIRNLGSVKGGWWPHVVAFLIDKKSYTESSPAEPFGLTNYERSILKRVIKGNPDAVRIAVGWLRDFGVYQRARIRIRRTTEGTEAVYFQATNGNKPAHAATSISNRGEWRTIRPGYYKGVGANKGYRVWIENGTIYAEAAPNMGEKVSMPELGGKLLYEVNLEGRSVKLRLGESK